MKVAIEVDLSGVLQMFDGLLDASDLKEGGLGEQIHEILLQDALAQFQAGGIDPAWQPLARSTIKEKERMGYPRLTRFGLVNPTLAQRGGFGPANILERTGALMSSWTDEHDPHHFVKIDDDSVESGSELYYAPFHQNPSPGSRLPKRAIGITDNALQRIASAVQDYLGGQS